MTGQHLGAHLPNRIDLHQAYRAKTKRSPLSTRESSPTTSRPFTRLSGGRWTRWEVPVPQGAFCHRRWGRSKRSFVMRISRNFKRSGGERMNVERQGVAMRGRASPGRARRCGEMQCEARTGNGVAGPEMEWPGRAMLGDAGRGDSVRVEDK